MTIAFSALGANMTISDINMAGLEETQKLVKKTTGKDSNLQLIQLDVTQRDQIRESAVQAKQKFGKVDIIINNAGIVQGK